MKAIVKILKIAGAIIAVIVAAVVGAGFALNTKSVQNKILKKATDALTEKLHTKVEIDSVSISAYNADLHLYGMRIDDQQQQRLLGVEQVDIDFELIPLIFKKVNIDNATIKGVRAHLTKDTINGANYQFIIDAFKKDSTKAAKQVNDTVKKKKTEVNLKGITLEDVNLTYNQYKAAIGKLQLKGLQPGKRRITIEHLSSEWTAKSKHGPVANYVNIKLLNAKEKEKDKEFTIDLHALNFINDNHKPRKNYGKPKRGFFDANHLNVTAQMKANVRLQGKDSILVNLEECMAFDKVTGIDFKTLTFNAEILEKKTAKIKNFKVQQGDHTVLKFDNATLTLPSKKEGRKFAFQTSTITGTTQLKDISRAFSPALKNFTLPLNLQTVFSGNEEKLVFKNCKVNTTDKQLQIAATGDITGLKDKKKLDVHFYNISMYTNVSKAVQIINLFPLKRKFMMKQLSALKYLKYKGDFHVVYKKEIFQGLLTTKPGNLRFNFLIDNLTKYLRGHVQTNDFKLGEAVEMPNIGRIVCSADFEFDISSKRTAIVRKTRGGKLPIGEVSAKVDEVSFKGVYVRDIKGNIDSNGALAEGHIEQKNMYVDLLCDFTFDNTDNMNKMKIKPNMKMHKKYVSEDKLKRREEKKKQKELKKKLKAEQKAKEEAEEAKEKAAKEAEKAKKKAAKEAEKAKKKAEKEAKKAAKEAEKAAS